MNDRPLSWVIGNGSLISISLMATRVRLSRVGVAAAGGSVTWHELAR